MMDRDASDLDLPPRPLARARAWAHLLDDRFSLFGLRFGFDGLLGLIPGVGALVTLAGGAVMLTSAHQLRLPTLVKVKIIAYTAFDMGVGSVPILGDIVDFMFKAHVRSLKTIEKALGHRR